MTAARVPFDTPSANPYRLRSTPALVAQIEALEEFGTPFACSVRLPLAARYQKDVVVSGEDIARYSAPQFGSESV